MIDTHCHLTFPQLAEQVDQVIGRAVDAGIDRMICVGTTPDDAEAARSIAEQNSNLYFTVGIHPHYVTDVANHDLPRLAQLGADPLCVAFGEMGMDYHYDEPPRDLQAQMFGDQLETIRYSEIDKPIVLHCRKAIDDTLSILKGSGFPGDRFVFHCFTETPDDVKKVLDFGAMVSFTGIVTYSNAPEVRESCLLVPDDRLMLETDSPYLTPVPHRKVRPNEPRFVADVYRFVAELRKVKLDTLIEQVDANAERFYRLPKAGLRILEC